MHHRGIEDYFCLFKDIISIIGLPSNLKDIWRQPEIIGSADLRPFRINFGTWFSVRMSKIIVECC